MPRDRTADSSGSAARVRLAELTEKKAAQIRALWPEIKAALDKGHRQESVCECLAADGIIVSARSLASYISRIRRVSTASHDRVTSVRANARTSPGSEEKPSALISPESKLKPLKDPLANVRERQQKRSGFDYRPELADLKDLI